MKKYLLYAWIVSAFCSCSENSMEPLPIEVDADCVDIVNDESFVPVSQATEVAGLFLAKQSGFSIWMDETNWAIKESDMQNAETLANMRSMWEAYEILPATTRDATSDLIVMGQCFVKG